MSKNSVQKMVAKTNQLVAENMRVSIGAAFETMLDLIAWKARLIGSSLPNGFTQEEAKATLQNFSFQSYKQAGWDHLGDYYSELQPGKQAGELLGRTAATELATAYAQNRDEDVRILDPQCSTGRYIIAAHEIFAKNGFYMGCEDNRIFYKIALLNVVILEIPAAILYANAMQIDLGKESNWDACNEWV